MFFERFDYAMTHLGWLGFLTAVYFAGIGLWFARLLWHRSLESAWQERAEIFEEYRTLNQRAAENQVELLEAFEIQENGLLQKDAQLVAARSGRDEAIAHTDRLEQQHQSDELKLSHRDTEIQLLRAQLESAQHEIDAQQMAADQQLAQQETRTGSLQERMTKLEATLKQANEQTKNAQDQLATSDHELGELRSKYAELMQQFAKAKDGQATLAQKNKQHDELRTHLTRLQDELSAAQAKCNERDNKCRDLNGELETVRAELDTRSMALDDLLALQASTVVELQSARESATDAQELQAQLDKLRQNNIAIENELEQTLLGEHNAKLQLADVSKQLAAMQQSANAINEKYMADQAADRQVISELREQLDEAEARLSEIVERPADADDLTEIVGLSRRVEEQLNEAGVFRFDQVACWTNKQERGVEKLLNLPGRVRDGQWVQQAKDLAGLAEAERSGEHQPEPSRPKITSYVRALRKYGNLSVKVDESLGVLFTRRPAHVDDLTTIRGIGKVNERCLRKAGVYQLQQIADWNEYNIWAFNQLLSFKGRIEREDWVGQALSLLKQQDNDGKVASIAMPQEDLTKEDLTNKPTRRAA